MRLIESARARERRRGGVVLSVVAHAALVALAIVATTRTGRTNEIAAPLPDIVYRTMPDDVRPADRGGPSSGGDGRSAERTPTTGGPTVDVPTTIPDRIPDLDVDVGRDIGRITRTPDVGLGRSSVGGRDGLGGGGAPGGGPGADGVWSAHVVEVPAAPHADNPVPSYPDLLRTAGAAGQVTAEFVVDSTGRVRPGTLRIVASTHELFAVSVRRTIPSMRFLPARAQGRAVPQLVRMPFVFEVRP